MGIFDIIKKKGSSTQDSEQRYAISLVSGHYEMRPPDINLWCIGNDYKPCVVIMPLSAWERMDSIIILTTVEQWKRTGSEIANAKYSEGQQLLVVTVASASGEELSNELTFVSTCGCKRLYTDSPILVPVLMSVASFNNYCMPLAHCIEGHLTPPKSLAQSFLQNVEFIESDEALCIPLKRRAKNLGRHDKFTMLPNGDKIEIFETYTINKR
jgi:hypothetical protein